MTQRQLSSDFILELAKLCLTDKHILEICREHLKYHYLFNEQQKKIFQFIFDSYTVTNKIPTIGMIGQTYSTDGELISILSKIKNIIVQKEQYDEILSVFEDFIRDSQFRVLYDNLGDLYNEGKKEKAITLLKEQGEKISQFKLKNSFYSTVFSGFEERNIKRQEMSDVKLLDKVTSGIHELDNYSRGGYNKGTSTLVMARSGVGKSTYLRWVGLCNARLGRRVVHFQAEGTEQECLDAYDAGWTGIKLHDIEFGNISDKHRESIMKAQRNIMASGGEIFVYASESFDSMSMENCNEILKDIISTYGPVDLAIFDYLELFTVKGQFGSSEASERKRREEVANKITNIATEHKLASVAAYQAQDISPTLYNNEEFVMTRHHASEFKNIVKPFSNFITLNQTDDEYENEIVRIWVDKFRKYKKPPKPIRIYQARNIGRFYNSKRTLEEFYPEGNLQ